ncbi:TlpA family protein disulfide reductase [Candidatus Avelusimicrobium luingense]|uniref:TlpA family protein disulfide reductase n=1 Tax=Candidatus Avelusimicrobium luingense TaxID=3416211 RepID=UPI003D13AD2B
MKKITLLLVTTLGLCACMAQLPQRPSLPQVQLPIVGEETAMWNPADYEGKPVMIVFMGSWCPWCKRTMPAVMQAAQDFAGKAEIVAVFLDDNPEAVQAAIKQNNFTVKSLYNGGELAQALEVQGLPHTIVFNKKHYLSHYWEGFSSNRLNDYRAALGQLTD